MPFDKDMNTLYEQAVEPSVMRSGHRSIRLDREGLPGDVGKQIEEGIATCDYVIVVLDLAKPNVFYELGLAHAQSKPVIILRNRKETPPVPFDISMHQRIEYDRIDDVLLDRICAAISAISVPGVQARLRRLGD
jgi:nucleoside 2-deoxyribosyltransferase